MNRKTGWFIVGGLLVALLLAGVVSNFASADPDGLDSATLEGCTVDAEGDITGGSCIAQDAKSHELSDSPLADYGLRGIDNAFLSTGLSGVLGVLITFAIGGAIFWLMRRRQPEQQGLMRRRQPEQQGLMRRRQPVVDEGEADEGAEPPIHAGGA